MTLCGSKLTQNFANGQPYFQLTQPATQPATQQPRTVVPKTFTALLHQNLRLLKWNTSGLLKDNSQSASNLYKSSRLLMEYYKSSPRLICFKVISSLSREYFKTNLTKDYCNPYSRLLFDYFVTGKPNFYQTSSRINTF